MNNNQVVTRELVDLKFKVMMQKIDKLYLKCKMLFKNFETRESKSLKVIKEQYFQMYNRLVETGKYEKYKEVEDIVIKEIAKVEFNIDQYIYDTIQSYQEAIDGIIQNVYQSRHYQNFNNLDPKIQDLGTLKGVLKLYSPYISKEKIEKTQQKITKLKFDLLYRKQVEELIYKNGGKDSNLLKYDNKIEKEYFKKFLEQKINSLKNKIVDNMERNEEDDELFKIPIEQVLNDSKALERLIIIDMKKNPYNYINLVKAKVFNAHLCNIGNNPFKYEVYITEEQLHKLGYWKRYDRGYGFMRRGKFEGIKANKVNYSILEALLKNIITDENVTYMDCENLYKRFGFECNPILINIGQQCVKMILDEVKESEEYRNILNQLEKKKENSQEQYCRIYFEGLEYNFESKNKDTENLFDEVISKRNIKLASPQKTTKDEYILQKRKEKIKTERRITTDIDIIILLIKDEIDQYNDKLNKLKEKNELEIKRAYEYRIEREQNKIQWLEKLKSGKEKLTLENTRKLLVIINHVYDELDIKHNVRNILPLEDMYFAEGKQVYLASIPEERGVRRVEVSHSFFYGSEYKNIPYYKSDLKPLWKKYQMEFKDLGIDVKKYSGHYESEPQFEICVNLADISDLPIDYEKVKLLTKEELQEIIEREREERRNER